MKQALIGAIGALLLAMALLAPGAGAANWAVSNGFPSGADAGSGSHGIAIDQANGDVYATILGTGINKLDSSGTPIGSPFTSAGSNNFLGVAVSPPGAANAGDVYGASPMFLGDNKLHTFTSAGTEIGTPFALNALFVQIASDSEGNIYIPNGAAATVTKVDPSGTVLDTIDCSDCPGGGAFSNPVSVAVDSAGNVYVVDNGDDRVLKFDSSGNYLSTLQSGQSAGAVAVNTASDTVFVGDIDTVTPENHIVAYNSSGSQIADFGGSDLGTNSVDSNNLGQLAVNSSTGDVYALDFDTGLIIVFSPVQPSPLTTDASGLAQTSATLNGTVNPQNGGAITDCHFDWGADTNYTGGSVNCASNPPDGNTDVPVTANLPGLTANTPYHYQLVVDNGSGPQTGGDKTLITLPNPPTATTGGSSAISQHAATIAATVNPHGGALSTCKFEWGPSAGTYTAGSAACPTDAGTSTIDVAESLNLAGLTPNTTYHYHLIATNAGGGPIDGGDMSLTTLADTCATNAALCPPPPPPPSCANTPSLCPPPPGSNRNEAAYKVCVKKANKAYKKAKSHNAKQAATKKKKAIKKCKARFL